MSDQLVPKGNLLNSRYLKFLEGADDYSDLSFSSEEATYIRAKLSHLSTGSFSKIPLICENDCPFQDNCVFAELGKKPLKKPCHPPGEMVLTAKHGYIPIEDLDPQKHKLVSWIRRHNNIRYNRHGKITFKKSKRNYSGNLIEIETESGCRYRCTHDHICIAQFNEYAVDKFVVYLMNKDEDWRIGQCKLVCSYKKNNKYGHQNYLNFINRCRTEKTNKAWILGVYETNTEALLAEEYYSVKWQTSKACFITYKHKNRKWNGLYKWVTQIQLNNHHMSLRNDKNFYKTKLESIGLDIDYPIFDSSFESRTGDRLTVNTPINIRACNLLPKVMSCPVIPEVDRKAVSIVGTKRIRKSTSRFYLADREVITKINRIPYNGIVYSLEVDKHETYFVDNIVTHNCLIERELLKEWTISLIKEYDIHPDSITDRFYIQELAEIELLLYRINHSLSKAEYALLIKDSIVNVTPQGVEIYEEKVVPLMELKLKLQTRKDKIVKLMVGDRQEKYKKQAALKQNETKDISSRSSNLRSDLERLQRQLVIMSTKLDDKPPEEAISDEILNNNIEEEEEETPDIIDSFFNLDEE